MPSKPKGKAPELTKERAKDALEAILDRYGIEHVPNQIKRPGRTATARPTR